MQYIAIMMYNLANMQSSLTISHTFRNEFVPLLNFAVLGMYSFPFKSPGLGGLITCHEWALGCHEEYSGTVHFLNPGAKKTIRRKKNTVHLYSPGLLFREDTRGGTLPRQETYMNFRGGELCGLLKFTGEKYRYCCFLDIENKIGGVMKEAALICSRRGGNSFWEVQALLARCISIMLNDSKKIADNSYEIIGANESEDLFIENVEKYIRHNISQTIKNSELAAYMNLSESTFNHRFKKQTGLSPKARVLEIKIDTVKGLLLKGRRMKEIAEFTGFHDEFHLSKIFKKKTGISPMEFRSAGE